MPLHKKKFDTKKFAVKADEKDLNVYSLKIGNKGNAKVYVERKEDLDALIQSYKDSCGLDAMIQLLKRGQISATALADDGQHSGDGTIPTELGPAMLYANDQVIAGDALLKALGLSASDLDSPDFEAKVKAAITSLTTPEVKEDAKQ